jgi:biotin synthase
MRCQKPSSLLKAGARALSKPQSVVRQYGTVSSISPQVTAPQSSVFDNALAADAPRNNWTKEEIREIYDTPLMNLAFAAVSRLSNIQAMVEFC